MYCAPLTSHGGSESSPQNLYMSIFRVSQKIDHVFFQCEQEACLEYNIKGEHYANVYTSVPRPCACRICWLHLVSE
jgi:hypothetical protein